MNIELIMLDNPIIVSDEEIKVGDKIFLDDQRIEVCSNAHYDRSSIWFKEGMLETMPKYCKKIIAGLPKLPKIDWNNLEHKFGYVDVEKLARKEYTKHSVKDDRLSLDEQIQRSGGFDVGFKEGFKKAQELSDKKFSLEDMKKSFLSGLVLGEKTPGGSKNSEFEYLIEQLSQPKVFFIEVEMDAYCMLCDKGSDKTNRCKQVRGEVRRCNIDLDLHPKITDGKIKITKKL